MMRTLMPWSILQVASVGALFAAVILAPSAYAQSTSAAAQLNRPSGVFEGEVNEFVVNPVGPVEYSISDSWGSASTFAQAAFGVLKARATSSATGEAFGRFFSRSGAAFNDVFTVTSLGAEGQSGTIHALFIYDRSLTAQGNLVDSYATATLTIGTQFANTSVFETLSLQPSSCVPGVSAGPCSLQLTNDVNPSAVGVQFLSPNTIAVSIPVTFGEATNFSMSIDMTALASYYEGASTWTSDAAHTLYWGGISEVTSQSGESLAFDIASASGTNYVQALTPVPEPTAVLMLISGLGVLGLRAAKRTERSRRST